MRGQSLSVWFNFSDRRMTMPELPEVETISRWLREGDPREQVHPSPPSVLGRTIKGVHLLWERTLATPGPAEFTARVIGQRIEDISRRGKYLIFFLSTDKMLVHLRMSGDLFVEPDTTPLAKHHRLALDLDSGLRLSFNDTRKFGRVWLVDDIETVVGDLGPEPLAADFTADRFFDLLHNRRRRLKSLLLDQRFVAGIGNIYADEAMFRAGLHPLTLASEITRVKSDALWAAVRSALKDGIDRHGASIDWAYRGGDFQNQFQVYQRTGEPCYRCGTEIARIQVAQRSTHFCPSCQPAREL
jgi:formamidopyrimidine-DNA glycosylase